MYFVSEENKVKIEFSLNINEYGLNNINLIKYTWYVLNYHEKYWEVLTRKAYQNYNNNFELDFHEILSYKTKKSQTFIENFLIYHEKIEIVLLCLKNV